jgi:hypothetical protein
LRVQPRRPEIEVEFDSRSEGRLTAEKRRFPRFDYEDKKPAGTEVRDPRNAKSYKGTKFARTEIE